MARVLVRQKPTATFEVVCKYCNSVIEYEKTELRWISDHPPYYGLDCPACNKHIFKDGSKW